MKTDFIYRGFHYPIQMITGDAYRALVGNHFTDGLPDGKTANHINVEDVEIDGADYVAKAIVKMIRDNGDGIYTHRQIIKTIRTSNNRIAPAIEWLISKGIISRKKINGIGYEYHLRSNK